MSLLEFWRWVQRSQVGDSEPPVLSPDEIYTEYEWTRAAAEHTADQAATERGKIGIAGAGVVGGTLARIARELSYPVGVYDPYQELTDPDALLGSRVIFVSVWTPMSEDGLDTSAVYDAVATAYTCNVPLIAVRSTVPLGVMTELEKRHPDQHFAFVPEFLVEADPYGSTRHADRIVIGTDRGEGRAREAILFLEDLLRAISPGSPVVRMSPEEAVMVKLASNGLLATKVAIAVELSDLAEAYGVDWEKVRGAVGLDHRIGPSHLTVTDERGYGGSCFPKDVQGIIGAANAAGVNAQIFDGIQAANLQRFRERA